MELFKKIKSIVTPFDRVNVDTDQIVPKQFLKLVPMILEIHLGLMLNLLLLLIDIKN